MKKRLNKKLKAFTLMELMVTMVVSAIIIGIIYNAYEIVYKQFLSYQEINNITAEGVLLNTVLTKDFVVSDEIRKDNGDIILWLPDSMWVKYEISQDYIKRLLPDHIDSFALATEQLEYKFMGEELKESGIIDEFVMEIRLKKELYSMQYYKEYDAGFLMALENKMESE